MNWFDILLIIIVALSIYSGWHKGFILGALGLLGWITGLFLAFIGYKYTAIFLLKLFPKLGVWTDPLAFILTLIFARIVTSIIVNSILRATSPTAHTSVVNRALGTLPGFVNGVITAAIIATILLVLPLSDGLTAAARDSRIGNQLTGYVEQIEAKLAPVFDDAIKRTMSRMTVEPESRKKVDLPFKVMDPNVREDLEKKMLVLVNEERIRARLRPLKPDPEMQQVARAQSRDMFARSYFSHINPDGKDPFDRMRQAKVRFITAGENLALAQTLNIAHTGLMHSPGHRANILQKSFGRVGIGILDGGRYGIMVTQNFRN